MRSAELRAATSRVGAIRAFGLLAFLALSARAAHLTVVDEQGDALWRRQVYAHIALPAARGVIYDRRGTELAVTTAAPSVYAIASAVDRDQLGALARALGMRRESIAKRLGRRSGFTYLARWVEPERAARVRELDLAGIGILDEPRRRYPAGALAGQSLGFADIDGKGVRGIEQQEDDWLSGSRVVVPVERDGGGRLLARAPLRASDAAGGDVALSIDASLQASADSALQNAVERTGARGGQIVSLDPQTGELLAIAEWPPFDPNTFRTTPYAATGAATFLEAGEPGSIMKVFLAAGALEEGAVNADEWLATDGGEIPVPGKTIRDRRDFGPLRLAGMLRVSSNVGAVDAAQRLGRESHHATLLRFGFGSPTGSNFPSESAGIVRPWRRWRPLDHATIAYGQGISATTIQVAAATAALANGGVWRTPRLVLARRAPGSDWKNEDAGPTRRAVSEETAAKVLDMMREVVAPGGTGGRAALAGVAVAGKTGTAQKLDAATGRYASDRYVAWFIGIVPADDPRLVIAVALDEPKDVHAGGAVAAPLFAQVASAQLAHLGVMTRPEPIAPVAPPTRVATTAPAAEPTPARPAQEQEVVAAVAPVALPPVASDAVASARAQKPATEPSQPLRQARKAPATGERVLVPDFRGQTLAEVRRITEIHELDLNASGRGQAIAQEPAPGTILGAHERRVQVRFASATAPRRRR